MKHMTASPDDSLPCEVGEDAFVGGALNVAGAVKFYPSTQTPALNDISFGIGENEFFTLLGPSGCGKTTLLRAIAGFEDLTAGSIRLDGESIETLAPNQRPINTVFQHYALFPHMTVAENVAYPLRRLRWEPAAIEQRVAQMLGLVKLAEMAERKPAKLSGGQQQRIALARALAPSPKLLLLDEPLSALDLKLRREMRTELKQIQIKTGITFLFVTHDQEEALAMSDRVAVMNSGRVEQIGSPEAIYNSPANEFVATFIGETNLLAGRVERAASGAAQISVLGGLGLAVDAGLSLGERVVVSVRLEKVDLLPPGQTALDAVVEQTVFLGTDTVVHLKVGAQALQARLQHADHARPVPAPGDRCSLRIDPSAATVLTPAVR